MNHIPNCNLLTNKLGLLNTLQDHASRGRGPKLDFFPETYRLDDPKDRELFMDTWQGERWREGESGRAREKSERVREKK